MQLHCLTPSMWVHRHQGHPHGWVCHLRDLVDSICMEGSTLQCICVALDPLLNQAQDNPEWLEATIA